MIRILVPLLITLALFSGCTSGDSKAAELLATARFEEKQGNYDHAAQLYAEILKRYPSSPAAKDAAAGSAKPVRRTP